MSRVTGEQATALFENQIDPAFPSHDEWRQATEVAPLVPEIFGEHGSFIGRVIPDPGAMAPLARADLVRHQLEHFDRTFEGASVVQSIAMVVADHTYLFAGNPILTTSAAVTEEQRLRQGDMYAKGGVRVLWTPQEGIRAMQTNGSNTALHAVEGGAHVIDLANNRRLRFSADELGPVVRQDIRHEVGFMEAGRLRMAGAQAQLYRDALHNLLAAASYPQMRRFDREVLGRQRGTHHAIRDAGRYIATELNNTRNTSLTRGVEQLRITMQMFQAELYPHADHHFDLNTGRARSLHDVCYRVAGYFRVVLARGRERGYM